MAKMGKLTVELDLSQDDHNGLESRTSEIQISQKNRTLNNLINPTKLQMVLWVHLNDYPHTISQWFRVMHCQFSGKNWVKDFFWTACKVPLVLFSTDVTYLCRPLHMQKQVCFLKLTTRRNQRSLPQISSRNRCNPCSEVKEVATWHKA
jgi:hypothetical protein